MTSRTIAGAAIDVFDTEPLPADHPFRTLDNVLATPHIGYVAENLYRTFYSDAATSIGAWLDEIATAIRLDRGRGDCGDRSPMTRFASPLAGEGVTRTTLVR